MEATKNECEYECVGVTADDLEARLGEGNVPEHPLLRGSAALALHPGCPCILMPSGPLLATDAHTFIPRDCDGVSNVRFRTAGVRRAALCWGAPGDPGGEAVDEWRSGGGGEDPDRDRWVTFERTRERGIDMMGLGRQLYLVVTRLPGHGPVEFCYERIFFQLAMHGS